jgi:hypothetical protein
MYPGEQAHLDLSQGCHNELSVLLAPASAEDGTLNVTLPQWSISISLA